MKEMLKESRKIGQYTVNERLTKALNVEGWVIYRDPSVGLYCTPLDGVDGEEFMLGYYSAVQISDIKSFADEVRNSIDVQKKEWSR